MSARLVVITGDGPEHIYVTNRICSELDVAAILVADPPPRRSWKKVLRKSPGKFLDKALWRLFLKATRDEEKRRAELARIFGADRCVRFDEPEKVVRAGRPKSAGFLAQVERLKPDFIAVYGTGIIPDPVLKLASVKAFNMHTGISPYYRGSSCAFWPIHEGESERVGATVHECTSAIDGGEIYAVRRAPLFSDDSLHSVFARAAAAGADAYVEVLKQAMAGRLAGEGQDLSKGREFPGSKRGLAAELRARLRLRKLRPGWSEPSG